MDELPSFETVARRHVFDGQGTIVRLENDEYRTFVVEAMEDGLPWSFTGGNSLLSES